MGWEYLAKCKDCRKEFGYSETSLASGSSRGLTRPERCPSCRRIHSRESRAIGIPQIPVKPTGQRKPNSELQPGRLGKISHEERIHHKVEVKGKLGDAAAGIEFGITDDDVRRLISALRDAKVAVVVGPTGSGKSTYLPYRLMVPPDGIEPDLFTRYGQIVVTQPRIQATRKIAEFVARDLHGSSLGAGFDVGFRHSGSPSSDWRNKLVYVTDGTLINWIVSGQLANLSLIIIDEAHERSLNIDLILGLLKQQLPRFPHLRLVIASATINAELFQKFYGEPAEVPILRFRGLKQHQVETYFPDQSDSRLQIGRHVPREAAEKVCEILKSVAAGERAEGNILVFLDGSESIVNCVRLIEERIAVTPILSGRGVRVLPLHSKLPLADQDLALVQQPVVVARAIADRARDGNGTQFIGLLLDDRGAAACADLVRAELATLADEAWVVETLKGDEREIAARPKHVVLASHAHFGRLAVPGGYHVVADRRVVVSTNLAETSLTVDGIVYVVDSGLIFQPRWVCEESADEMKTIFHSRAGCRQRWGRAGRVRDGEAHTLYSDLQFEDDSVFPPYAEPDIKKTSIEQLVLKAKAAGVDDVTKFEWFEAPSEIEMLRVPEVLRGLGALDEDGDLTEFGLELEGYLEKVRVSNLLVAADRYACGVEMATVASMLDLGISRGLFRWDYSWDFTTVEQVDEIRTRLQQGCHDDLDFLLKIWSIYSETPAGIRDELVRLFFLDGDRIRDKVVPARAKLMELLAVGKRTLEDRPTIFARLDRLRFVLAVHAQEDALYRFSDGKVLSCYPVHGRESLPVEIDKDSVVAAAVPPCFVAMKRRIAGPDARGGKRLEIAALVRVDADWLALRDRPFLEAALHARALPGDPESEAPPGRTRHRVLLNVTWPMGATFATTTGADGSLRIGELQALSPPLEPAVHEERASRIGIDDEAAESDTNPAAGDLDPTDSSIPHDEDDERSWPTYADQDEDESDSWAGFVGANDSMQASAEQVDEPAGGGICTAEVSAAAVLVPAMRVQGPSSPGQRIVIVGHNFDDPGQPALVVAEATSATAGGPETLKDGAELDVDVVGVQERPDGNAALRVRERTTGREFLIEDNRLSFHRVRGIAKRYASLKEMRCVSRVDSQGRVILTRLPIASREVRDFLANPPSEVQARLVERWGGRCRFEIPAPGTGTPMIVECKARKGRAGKRGREFDLLTVGQSLTLYPYGEAPLPRGVALPMPSPQLRSHVAAQRAALGVFLGADGMLYADHPMSEAAVVSLLGTCAGPGETVAVWQLYRKSNELRLCDGPGVRNSLHMSGRSMRDHVPGLRPEGLARGESVRGRVAEIGLSGATLVLDNGALGFIPMAGLAPLRSTDPREKVALDQSVEAFVDSCAGGRLKLRLFRLAVVSKPGFQPGMFIGRNAANLKRVQSETGCSFLVEDGRIHVGYEDESSLKRAEAILDDYVQFTTSINVSPLELRFLSGPAGVLRGLQQDRRWTIRVDEAASQIQVRCVGALNLEALKKELASVQTKTLELPGFDGRAFRGAGNENIRRISMETGCFFEVRQDGVAVAYRDQADLVRAQDELKKYVRTEPVPPPEIKVEAGLDRATVLFWLGPGRRKVGEIGARTGCVIEFDRAGARVRLTARDQGALTTARNALVGVKTVTVTLAPGFNAGAFIGQGGQNVRAVSAASGCGFDVRQRDATIAADTVDALERGKQALTSYVSRARIQIPREKIALAIGPRGSHVQAIASKSGCRVNVSQDGQVSIDGETRDQMLVAVRLLKQLGVPVLAGDPEADEGGSRVC